MTIAAEAFNQAGEKVLEFRQRGSDRGGVATVWLLRLPCHPDRFKSQKGLVITVYEATMADDYLKATSQLCSEWNKQKRAPIGRPFCVR